ncbi:cyclic pyranopterin monophosphate synthase MoaC [Bacillus horti]|uniref:Cyclic pyranopterin monophosphate synthase n=1 Tax=Caldalkalibacillus horti TaxID=77523 RepID=A0ABT9W587_9BACI|nr:cyclic pyranopterin monophosphate synthase MoaC [Bacillus horti]MDQ0168290.1 cyclic pyranopterin phosphate synthase [Bacillus horti]
MDSFTHFNEQGRAKMVDISEKKQTSRSAVAVTQVKMTKLAFDQVQAGKVGKGDVLAVAQVAAIMAAKQTSNIVPMCHPLSLTGVDIRFDLEATDQEGLIKVEAEVKTTGKTGVEMEALTAASVCALTIYDMCKAIDKDMVIGPTYVTSKTGGKSGDYHRNPTKGGA